MKNNFIPILGDTHVLVPGEEQPKKEDIVQKQLTEKELTIKQRRWLEKYIETGNATEAAMQVYDCKDRDSASQIGFENLRKLDFIDFLERMNLTDKKIVEVLNKGLEATKEIAAVILIDKNGEVISKENEGQIQVADYATRHKYLESLLKLKGKFKHAEIQVLNQTNINGQQGIPILGDMSTDMNVITYQNYSVKIEDKTDKELHKVIEEAESELKKRKALNPEEFFKSEEQASETVTEPPIIDLTPIDQPQEQSAPPELDKLDTPIKEEDPQAIIDKRKHSASFASPLQEDLREEVTFPRQANDPFAIGE